MDIKAFMQALVASTLSGDGEWDGADIEEALCEHGVLVRLPLTAADLADENHPAHAYGCEVGNTWFFAAPEFKKWLRP